MLILALETSDCGGSVALLEDDQVLAFRALEPAKRSAKWLAPAINQVLQEAERKAGDVQLIAVTTGPGSFTGLRVGVTTAKMMAYAVGCRVIGVNTLEAIAMRVPLADGKRVWAVIDAQRQQLFAACYSREAGGKSTAVHETSIATSRDWLAKLTAGDTIIGPGLAKVTDEIPPGVEIAAAELSAARAIEVGLLGFAAFKEGRRDDPFLLVPEYFRPTAAEEQWARKNAPPAA
jgi:tRNA threonylcarbamoyladenosine biosynthesis protein TsaB